MTKMATAHQMWIEQRRNILLEILAEHPNKEWSVREIEEAVRSHPIIKERQPNLGKSTIATDLAAVRGSMLTRRADLAETVIAQQATISDQMLVDAFNLWQRLIDEFNSPIELPENEEGGIDMHLMERIKNDRMKRLDTAGKMVERVMQRQGRIMPAVEVAKQLDISSGGITLANFLQLRQKAGLAEVSRPQLVDKVSEEYIDGEFEESA